LLLIAKQGHIIVLNLCYLLLSFILNLEYLEITRFFFIFVSTHEKPARLRKNKASGNINFNIVEIKFI
jgi:hypothetical protein